LGLIVYVKYGNSLYNIDHLDDLAKNNTFIHKLHPLVKLVTTLAFLVVVASFGKYEIARLFPLFFYPVIVISLAELPPAPILKRILVVEPFVVGIGILKSAFESKLLCWEVLPFQRAGLPLCRFL